MRNYCIQDKLQPRNRRYDSRERISYESYLSLGANIATPGHQNVLKEPSRQDVYSVQLEIIFVFDGSSIGSFYLHGR